MSVRTVSLCLTYTRICFTESDSSLSDSETDLTFVPDESLKKDIAVLLKVKVSTADKEVQTLMINLDRGKISTSDAFRTVSAVSVVANIDLTKLKLSRSCIQRKRKKVRAMIAASIRGEFHPDVPLTVHMDGKKIPPLTGKGDVVERLPVLVTGKGVNQLLASNVLPRGNGRDISDEVVAQLQNYKLTEKVKCVSCDTTSSNTGCHPVDTIPLK
ncbi:uncharacterized protein LOC127750092 [Frankliniella occidentalis]|uniref:Uncharacterized protein LOC127750092 n=1 Tax=Frankliniella occidentalis TaxID=133901 RepID=A0A9C6UAK4_FRAOC|nr:uncharacterized protein LOC127750092 [Frankliniella occidentalis]